MCLFVGGGGGGGRLEVAGSFGALVSGNIYARDAPNVIWRAEVVLDDHTFAFAILQRLRQVVQKTLQDNGIDCNHEFYQSCSDRLYSLCKSFLKVSCSASLNKNKTFIHGKMSEN